jgi:hypothetical protein
MTHEQLAERVGTTSLVIARLERGELLVVEDLLFMRKTLEHLNLAVCDDAGIPLPRISSDEDDHRPRVALVGADGIEYMRLPIDHPSCLPDTRSMVFGNDDGSSWEVEFQLQPVESADPPWAYVETSRRQLRL